MADHDSSYRLLFSQPRMVEDLLRGFVKEPWVEDLDFTRLEPVRGRYVSDRLRQREADVVWRLPSLQDEWLYVYLMIEFQSTVDPFMAVRVLAYVALLYQDLIRRQELTPAGLLPPVLPMVLYNGQDAWRAAREVAELIAPVPGGLAGYRPRFRYFLIDEGRLSRTEVTRQSNLAAGLFRIEQSRRPEELEAGIGALGRLLRRTGTRELRRAFETWLSEVVLPSRLGPGERVGSRDFGEVETMLRETVAEWKREWREEGLREGREEGLQQGEAALLMRQLERRFGPLTTDVRERIAAAGSEQLLNWGDRILTAQSLEQVFQH